MLLTGAGTEEIEPMYSRVLLIKRLDESDIPLYSPVGEKTCFKQLQVSFMDTSRAVFRGGGEESKEENIEANSVPGGANLTVRLGVQEEVQNKARCNMTCRY